MGKLLFLAVFAFPVAGLCDPIYRTTDAQGNVIFTDAPPAASQSTEQVELQPLNTTSPPPSLPKGSSRLGQNKRAADRGYSIAITDPANDTSIPSRAGDFTVSARIEPATAVSLQLFLDGTPWGEPQNNALWQLTSVIRGQHDLTVAAVDSDGEVLEQSAPVRVYVHRPSVNFRK